MRSIVLVEPEIPENTGFIARLCSNFNFKLRLVNPDFNLSECRSTAQNCQGILREAKIFDSLDEAIADLDFVVGTKPDKGLNCRDFEFRENTSIVLGRESSGLTNSELEICDSIVHIDAQGYSSLNLSHAAGILMYQASKVEDKNVDNDRLDAVESKTGKNLRDLIARASPTDSEIDRVLSELV
ncbi:MAG: RNA methyltransferase [Candidatus Nanohaloarchaea archaeon]